MAKTKYVKQQFESTGNSSDTSANIYESMLLSKAWMELTPNQKTLYVVCKSQYYSEKRKPDGVNSQFTMNRYKWCEKYKLYSAGNESGFYRDMSALIEKGFIKCVASGATTRTKSVYQFSSMWQKYGQPGFEIKPSDMNLTLLRRRQKDIKQ